MFRCFLKPQVFAAGAQGESGGVRDPVEPALFPRLPTFGQFLVRKHQPQILNRQRATDASSDGLTPITDLV